MQRYIRLVMGVLALIGAWSAVADPHIQADPDNYRVKSDLSLSTGQTVAAGTIWYNPPDIEKLKDELAKNIYKGDVAQARKLVFGHDIIYDTYHTVGEGRKDGHPPLAKGRIFNCGNCHARGGTVPYAWPFFRTLTHYGLSENKDPGIFSNNLGYHRDARVRARDCALECGGIVNIREDSPEMDALVAWFAAVRDGIYPGEGLLIPEFKTKADVGKIPGATLPLFPDVLKMRVDVKAGATLYKNNCSSCHGKDGAGMWAEGVGYEIPPLAGPNAFADVGGPLMVPIGAAFLYRNMPMFNFGAISEQQALDIMGFVASLPRQTVWWNPYFFKHDPCGRPPFLPLHVGAVPKGFPFSKKQAQFGPWKEIADWLASDACRAQNKKSTPELTSHFDPLTPK